MNNIFCRCLLFFFVLLQTTASAQKDWVLQKEINGVKIYKRKTDDGHEIKLASTFNVAPAALVALFNNVPEYPKWGYKVAHSELLKRISDTDFYYYSRFDFPWPLNDRDVVMHTTIATEATTKIVTLTSKAEPDYIPEKEDLVRVRKANVTWQLTPKTDGTTEGEYSLNMSPGGLLPDAAVALASDDGPVETVQKMKKLLAEERYKNVKLQFRGQTPAKPHPPAGPLATLSARPKPGGRTRGAKRGGG